MILLLMQYSYGLNSKRQLKLPKKQGIEIINIL